MTARLVIDQIKALPPEEQVKVLDFLEEVKSARQGRAMEGKTFEESAKGVFTRHAELLRKLGK
jgi:transcriptional regulator with AAA-type ATPase domain